MHAAREKRPILELAAILLPGVYLAVALSADIIIPEGLLTPFFVVVGFLFMALTYRPVVMIPWAVVYTVVLCNIILVPKLFILFSGHPYREPYMMAVLRAVTYFLVGVLASYLCIALNRLRKSEEELTHILKNIPWPILTSDKNGRILYWNAPAAALLPELSKSQGALNYFDLLAPPEFHGRTISEYHKRFEGEQSVEALKLSVQGRPYKGQTRKIEWTDSKVLLTVLVEGEISPTAF
jgi:PAS domain-containing protein